MSGSAKVGTIAERHTCELRVLLESAVRAPPKRASGGFFSPCHRTYMDVRNPKALNKGRVARFREARTNISKDPFHRPGFAEAPGGSPPEGEEGWIFSPLSK